MRIAIFTGIFPPDIGGPATYVPQLASHLERQGYETRLLTLSDQKYDAELYGGFQVERILRKQNKLKRIVNTILRMQNLAFSAQFLFVNGLYEEASIVKLLHPKKRFTAKIVGDPVWERFRNQTSSAITIEEFNSQGFQVPLKYRCQRKMLVWSLNRFDSITCPSNQLKQIIKDWGVQQAVAVIHNGIECKIGSEEELAFDVVTISRLVSWKNIDTVIRACAQLGLSLAIVGDGPELNHLSTLASDLAAKATFLGQLPPDEITEILSKSAIYVLLSDYEGLSFSLLEAMMNGNAVVVSDAKGNTDVVTNLVNGVVTKKNDVQDLIKNLGMLRENEALLEQIGKAAHESAVAGYCRDSQLDLMARQISGYEKLPK
jgi:glycosyltransferase involved in cell wall biosynthesis